MKDMYINNGGNIDFDPSLFAKAKKMHMIKIRELDLSSFPKFEKDNLRNVFNLFKMDKDNKMILYKELNINPYISIHEIPLCYKKNKALEKSDVFKNELVVFYPSFLATGKLRIEFYPLKIYGRFYKSLFEIDRQFILFELIQIFADSNKNLEYSLIENRMIIAVRNLLCNQLLILK